MEVATIMTPEEYRTIISDAINREVESYTFYQKVSDRVADANLKKLFGELAGDEKAHREYLQKLLSREITSLGFSSTKDYKVGDSIPTPPLTPDMKPVDGLVVAIKKELEAMQMYTQLANNTDDPETEKLFTELAAMERGHKARLEDIYVNTAFAETW
jgi:rubrerythrin